MAEQYQQRFAVSIHASGHVPRNSCGFNPRVLPRGRDTCLRAPIASGLFQSTRTPGRTRLKSYLFRVSDQCFNPRVLAGGRDFPPAQRKPRCQGFNPRVLARGRDFPLLSE